jgi:DNA-binding NarL/FixJ family response regulator
MGGTHPCVLSAGLVGHITTGQTRPNFRWACRAIRIVYFARVDLPEDTLRVVLADGHHFFREGLRGMLETAGITVVGEAKDGAEAIALAGRLEPDVIVVDMNMRNVSDAAALRRIAAASPEARMVVLTTSTDEANVLEALAAGVCGYLLKDTAADELVGGIRQMTSSQVVLSREIVQELAKRVSSSNHGSNHSQAEIERVALTARETDVLRLIVEGADNAAIGLKLSISRHTVKQHVTNIFEKLDVRTRVEAAVYAVRSGLL